MSSVTAPAVTYRISHRTEYAYSEPVTVGQNLAYLTPRTTATQTLGPHQVLIDPNPAIQQERTDYFGNPFRYFSFPEGYGRLSVEGTSEVRVQDRQLDSAVPSPAWETVRDRLHTPEDDESLEAIAFCYASPQVTIPPGVREWATSVFSPGRPILEGIAQLTARVHAEFEYVSNSTTISSTVEDVLDSRRGVCQDFAHVQISMLRSLGLAARYVSGYLRTYPPPGQEKRIGSDASHAWVGLWCGPELGWVDVDPTNDLFVGNEHITLAWGRDFRDVSPLRGVLTGGGTARLTVGVDVSPIDAFRTERNGNT